MDTKTSRRAGTLRRGLTAGVAAVAAVLLTASPALAAPPVSVSTLREVSAARLADSLVGRGLKAQDATFTGNDVQAGLYRAPVLDKKNSTGVALSSGSLIDADPQSDADVDFTTSALIGPNTGLTTTGDFGGAGDADLTAQAGASSYDAAVLTFTVKPKHKNLFLEYGFGSEEYANWTAQGYNDALGIWLNGTLCSVVPGTSEPAGVGTINSAAHSELYVPNFTDRTPGTLPTEMNGFTKPLQCHAKVTPGATVTVKIAVADTLDGQLDTTLLLAAKSLYSSPQPR
jgi:hypothetical protein